MKNGERHSRSLQKDGWIIGETHLLISSIRPISVELSLRQMLLRRCTGRF